MILRLLIISLVLYSSAATRKTKSSKWANHGLFPTTPPPQGTTKLITSTNPYTGSTVSAPTGSSDLPSTAPTILSTSETLPPTKDRPTKPTIPVINSTTVTLIPTLPTTIRTELTTIPTLFPTNTTPEPTRAKSTPILTTRVTILPTNTTTDAIRNSTTLQVVTTLPKPNTTKPKPITTIIPTMPPKPETTKETVVTTKVLPANSSTLDPPSISRTPTSPSLSVNAVTCAKYGAPDYGALAASNLPPYSPGNKIGFFCDQLFLCDPSGCPKRTCQSDGTWSGVQPKCMPDTKYICPAMLQPEHSVITKGESEVYKLFDVVSLGCAAGFVAQGNVTAQCNNKGEWAVDFKCSATCPTFEAPANSVVESGAKDVQSESDLITLVCEDGYTAKGTNTALCNAQGVWDMHFICCKGCPDLTPIDNNLLKAAPTVYCPGDQILVQEGGPHLTCMLCKGVAEWRTEGCPGWLKLDYLYILSGAIGFLVIASILFVFIRKRIRKANQVKSADHSIINVTPLKSNEKIFMQRGRRWSQFSQFSEEF